MTDFLSSSVFFGLLLSLGAYMLGLFIRKKTGADLANPLLIAAVLVIAVLLLLRIPYESYYESARYLGYLLTPATICLAVPLYKQLQLLKKNLAALLTGILSGVAASLLCILSIGALFHLSKSQVITLLPKSITTAIGIAVSEENGGLPALTAAAIVITGVTGCVTGPLLCRIFRIREPMAKGLAFGVASHAIGTSRALEIGEIEGAMGSLAIAVAGIITAVIIPILATFLP